MFTKDEQLKKDKAKKVSTFGKKKSCLKNKSKKIKPLEENVDLLNQSITLRFSVKEVKNRVDWLLSNIGHCQICGTLSNLDYPHHALDGVSRKDDRTMICICVYCHREIHTKGFSNLSKTREEVESLGWTNNFKYLNKG